MSFSPKSRSLLPRHLPHWGDIWTASESRSGEGAMAAWAPIFPDTKVTGFPAAFRFLRSFSLVAVLSFRARLSGPPPPLFLSLPSRPLSFFRSLASRCIPLLPALPWRTEERRERKSWSENARSEIALQMSHCVAFPSLFFSSPSSLHRASHRHSRSVLSVGSGCPTSIGLFFFFLFAVSTSLSFSLGP